jgi:hypothetical protein
MSESMHSRPNTRIVVVEQVCHQSADCMPTSIEASFTKPQLTDEQVFTRSKSLSLEWTAIETGWITECSQMVIGNDRMSKANIEIRCGTNFIMTLVPSESLRCCPNDLTDISWRALGEARVQLYLYPK